ncbi:MAG: ATP-binding protein [bacterium]|nr:ATP-binding protein [bacterium]
MEFNKEYINSLLFEEESVVLDFKAEQYKFINASDEEKSELLKDILSFTNAWRRSDAFILIGIKEIKGGRSQLIGISKHLDDANLQQFVNTKTQKPITFSYRNIEIDNKIIGVIHIPIQQRPVYLKKEFGNLLKEIVYIRRGTSTDTVKPDEISIMGSNSELNHLDAPEIEIHLTDRINRKLLADTITLKSLVLKTPLSIDIPDYKEDRTNIRPNYFLLHTNYNYYRELSEYTKIYNTVSTVQFAIKNNGTVVAKEVKLEIKIEDPENKLVLLDSHNFPKRPKSSYDPLSAIYNKPRKHDISVKKISNYWLIEGTINKVQPKGNEWFQSNLFIGAIESLSLQLSCNLFADNLPNPIIKTLNIQISAEHRTVDLEEILELENERFLSSDEGKEFLKRMKLLE